MSTYISEGEAQYLRERRLEAMAKDVMIAKNNAELRGEVHEYKGIKYKRRGDGQYFVVGLDQLTELDGAYNNTGVLHWMIDNLERIGKLPKSK